MMDEAIRREITNAATRVGNEVAMLKEVVNVQGHHILRLWDHIEKIEGKLEPTTDTTDTTPTENVLSREIQDRINANYKAAMQDCQVPTGALAELNRTEFYIYTLESDLNSCRKYRAIPLTGRPLDRCRG